MLMSVFVQNIVDVIVDYALWVAFLRRRSFRRSLRADCSKEPDEQIKTVVAISEGADEVKESHFV